jgi:ABC-2 type transport system permease protein
MAAWGGMVAVISTGGNIANERQLGWTRQIRITPLPRRIYFQTKVLCGYLMALLTLAVLYLAGSMVGVSLNAGAWATMTGLIVVGLVPFVVLGILLGHVLTADSLGPAMGGVTSLLALLGGAWGPLATTGVFLSIVKVLPSYWLVQAGKTATGGHGWPVEAWIVLGFWVLGLGWLAGRVYLRDTARV